MFHTAVCHAVLEGDVMVYRWAVPISVALGSAMIAGPIVGLLVGILTALVWPPLAEWWNTRGYLQAVDRQSKFLEEYDVCAVSPADYEKMFLAVLGETDPSKAFLMDRKTMRQARRIFPTKAKTKADKKILWDKEEERRRSLGFPSQSQQRDFKAESPLYKPHYQHLKTGIRVATCWLCDQNTAEQDQRHFEIWSQVERDEAEERGKATRH